MPPPAFRIAAQLGALVSAHGAHAALQLPGQAGRASGADPAQLCRNAIAATERDTRIPDAFLAAIGRVESGRPNAGALSPWPWTVNAAGSGHFYPTKEAAIAAVRQFQADGVRAIDVGCLQVDLFYHPEAFASLEQAFDPALNAAFAAKLLLALFATTGSWPRAAAAYHSMTPALGLAYQQKVLAQWALPDQHEGEAPHRSARLRLQTDEPPVILPAEAPPARALAASPQMAAIGAGQAAPTLGFNRRFMLPASSPSAGRTLAAYRALPVRLAWRQGSPGHGAGR